MGRIKTGILLLAALLWALPSRAQEPFNPATLLQGRSPSVMVSPVTGCNGEDLSVLVRGGSGIRGDRQPVWIVDGVEINPSVSFLNLYDITDIKVLTNLSDVAPYGDRGANGVVLVTTGARRSEDPLSIRWNSDIGLSFPVLKITGTAPGFNHNHYDDSIEQRLPLKGADAEAFVKVFKDAGLADVEAIPLMKLPSNHGAESTESNCWYAFIGRKP